MKLEVLGEQPGGGCWQVRDYWKPGPEIEERGGGEKGEASQ